MGIYFSTVQREARVPHSHKQDRLYFNNRWWTEFSEWLIKETPEIEPYMNRFNYNYQNSHMHPHYTNSDGKSFPVIWTADDCRQIFNCLLKISQNGQQKAVDFWQFTALFSLGIIEEGITG